MTDDIIPTDITEQLDAFVIQSAANGYTGMTRMAEDALREIRRLRNLLVQFGPSFVANSFDQRPLLGTLPSDLKLDGV
jgi:uncharacterized protein YecE (DUF72 family)